jgi:hypothetical protein
MAGRFSVAFAVVVSVVSAAGAGDPRPAADRNSLVIHEWGTFTCLQDETGRAIPGVNTDDERVPNFVHRLSDLIQNPQRLAPIYFKGVPRSHRQVIMRLETPVVYFYPPANHDGPLTLDFEVGFRGGWLSEFYPDAEPDVPGLSHEQFRFHDLTARTVSHLRWNGLKINAPGELPDTNSPVWLSPREVPAATVVTPRGEAEKYLFYRGVGNIESPLAVVRSPGNDMLAIRSNEHLPIRSGHIAALWLVEIRNDGRVAYRALGPAELTGPGQELLTITGRFADTDYTDTNHDKLRDEMRTALIADGLYVAEAEAMLRTWQNAYFRSPGMRLFYILPKEWTDQVLPLKSSVEGKVSRTMVGRLEIVTPQQRDLLRVIGNTPTSRPQLGDLLTNPEKAPADYRAYLDLGRFRNALILDAVTTRPQGNLEQFAKTFGVGYFTP